MGLHRLVCGACVLMLSSAPAAAPRVHVHLKIQPTDEVPASMVTISIAEAARIWKPHGVVIEAAGLPAQCDAPSLPLSILLNGGHETSTKPDRLGMIRFQENGAPESSVVLYYRAVRQLAMSARSGGVRASQWPPRVRDEIVARALGRAMAHE